MTKFFGKKMNMAQVWKAEKAVPVTAVRMDEGADLESIKEGDLIKVSGTSRGRGFQGVVKRHGFGGGPRSHGQKDRLRAPGSIGATAPQRVIKGRHMAGHMGNVRVTARNLRVIEVKKDERIILVKGAVPGFEGGKIEMVKI